MNCKRVQEWISLEIDGQLAPDRVPHLQAHLEACPDCRTCREDLQLGRRLLLATNEGPPEGFEWRLQLRLNQSLKEAARDAVAPWPVAQPGWRPWLGHFGISASLGLATVLATAMFIMPTTGRMAEKITVAQDDGLGRRIPVATETAADLTDTSGDASRRPLTRPSVPETFDRGTGAFSRTVSGQSGGLTSLRPGTPLQFQRLERENEGLRRRLSASEYRAQRLQARLDSLARRP